MSQNTVIDLNYVAVLMNLNQEKNLMNIIIDAPASSLCDHGAKKKKRQAPGETSKQWLAGLVEMYLLLQECIPIPAKGEHL